MLPSDQLNQFLHSLAATLEGAIAFVLPFAVKFLPAQLLLAVKIASGVVSVLLFIALVMLSVRISRLIGGGPIERLTEAMRAAPIEPSRIAKHWKKIKQRLEKGSEAEWKLAVIEADKLCDTILRRMGYLGQSMGERLRAIKPAQLASLEQLWEAHKTRNTIVHDPQFYLSEYEAKKAIANYEVFLKEMHIIV